MWINQIFFTVCISKHVEWDKQPVFIAYNKYYILFFLIFEINNVF